MDVPSSDIKMNAYKTKVWFRVLFDFLHCAYPIKSFSIVFPFVSFSNRWIRVYADGTSVWVIYGWSRFRKYWRYWCCLRLYVKRRYKHNWSHFSPFFVYLWHNFVVNLSNQEFTDNELNLFNSDFLVWIKHKKEEWLCLMYPKLQII